MDIHCDLNGKAQTHMPKPTHIRRTMKKQKQLCWGRKILGKSLFFFFQISFTVLFQIKMTSLSADKIQVDVCETRPRKPGAAVCTAVHGFASNHTRMLANHRPLSLSSTRLGLFIHSCLTAPQGKYRPTRSCLSCHHCSRVSLSVGDPRSTVTRNLMGCAGCGSEGASPSGPLPTMATSQGCS